MFSDSAIRLAGLTAWLLGWRPAEFWRTTPAELAGVLQAAEAREGGGVPPDAATLRRLQEMFPDG